MARLSTRGSALATPFREQTELGACLADLGVDEAFDEKDRRNIYIELGRVVGRWMAEKGRLESARVEKTLRTMSKHLDEIGRILQGHETGSRNAVDMEIVSQLAECMAHDPAIGSIRAASELIASFGQEAARIAHSSLIVAVDLNRRSGKHGPSPFDWYDDFTALLLKIAKTAGVKPSSRKDRIRGERSGWLFDAGVALETFLYPADLEDEYVLGRIDIEEDHKNIGNGHDHDATALRVTIRQVRKPDELQRGTDEVVDGYFFRISNMYTMLVRQQLTHNLRCTIFKDFRSDVVGKNVDKNSIYKANTHHLVSLDGFAMGMDANLLFFSPVYIELVDDKDKLAKLDSILDVIPESKVPKRILQKLKRYPRIVR